MKPIFRHLAFTVLFFGTGNVAQAQLITQVSSPFWILPNLLGSEYVVSNIQQSGHWEAFGYFDGTNSNLGLSEGLVLTTGKVIGVSGPCGPNNQENSGIDNGFSGYTPLSTLIGGVATYNAAVLEFDVIVNADSIKIPFVFGSEEYLEYAGSAYNDPMAIFLSGPGIPGLQNIARLPMGTPVTINNVHPAVSNTFGTFPAANEAFYVDNLTSVSPTDSTKIQYDGFTVPIVATAAVNFGSTYHVIIAIADAGDPIYDSGLFIGKCASCTLTAGTPDLEQNFFEAFPNPSNGEFTLRSNIEVQYDVLDAAGRNVLRGSLMPGTEQSISGLGVGSYYVSFYNDDVKSVKKLVVL